MKKILSIIVLACFFSPSSYAAAEGDSYFGLQYALVTYDEDGFPDAQPTALVLRYGQFVNNSISVEGRLGIGLQDDTVNFLNTDVDIEVDSVFGVYGLFHAGSSDNVALYGVLGFTKGKLTASIPGDSISESDSGLSFGVGVDIQSFNIEYMLYLDEDFYSVSALSLGYNF